MSYEEDLDIIDIATLHLEQLVLNFRGNEKILVVNEDDETSFVGIEEEIRKNKPEWANYLVTCIFFNKEKGMIEVDISNELED